jgi:hypothetical protein
VHPFGEITVLAPVLKKVLHGIPAIGVPLLIGGIVLATLNNFYELSHAPLFFVIGILVEHTAEKDQHECNSTWNFQALLEGSRLFGCGMVAVNQAADDLLGHDDILAADDADEGINLSTCPPAHTGTRYSPPLNSE